MPQGYLVTLGDGSLDAGDAITGSQSTFTISSTIGSGQWNWSGIWDGNGNYYSNITDSGTYYVGSDGNVYFVPDTWYTTSGTATAINPPAYVAGNIVEGTSAGELIDNTYIDPDGDAVDDGTGNGAGGLDDEVYAGGGNDTVQAGDGADTVFGGAANDSIQGNDGDDVLHGDQTAAAPASLSMNWSDEGGNGTNLAGGFSQDTGGITVDVSFAEGPIADRIIMATTTQYVGSGEPFATNSSVRLTSDGSGSGVMSTTTLDFSADPTSGFADEVENVTFRINDIDTGGWQDVIEINAYDADGNPVTVTITPSGNDTVSGNTITAGSGGDAASSANGSALVTIAGPVASVEIIYSNAGTSGQALWITDVHFDAVPIEMGDDTIDGGAGNDEIYGYDGDDVLTGGTGADTIDGGAGADTFYLAEGDVATGGDGDDTFLLTDLGESGGSTISITGGEGDETNGDTLDFQGLIGWGDITYTDTNDAAGGLSGFATLADGTVVNFTEIENIIICFTAGTRILTPHGARPIETLRPGDMVITADNGLQPIRWIGARTVPARGKLAPIRFRQGGRFGNTRDLLVSPQHRMLIGDYHASLLFGQDEVLAAAKHLINGQDVTRKEGGMVTYVHMLFDRHEVIFAEGAASESFHPGQQGLEAILGPAREELFTLFPELRSNPNGYGDTSRLCLKKFEAKLLAA